MAEASTNTKTKKGKKVEIVKTEINLRPIDRTPKDLEKWKLALKSAEAIVMPSRRLLYDLYFDIILDPHLTSVIEKRVNAVLNTEWTFTVDGEEYDEISKFCDTLFFADILKYSLESKIWGYSLMQIDFNERCCDLIPRKHVVPTLHLVTKEPTTTFEGINYTEPPFDRLCLAVGDERDLGLLLKAAPYVLFKKGDVSDWAAYCELFGMPLRVAYYDPLNPANKAELTKAMDNAGSAAYLVLPDGSKVEFPSASGSAGTGNDTYHKFAAFCNEEISKLLLGNTMTTEVGKNGSRSQAEVHEQGEERIAAADRKFVERVLNERLPKLLEGQGIPFPKGGRFAVKDEEEEVTKKELLAMRIDIHTKVAPIKLEQFAEEFNVEFDQDALVKKQEREEQLHQQKITPIQIPLVKKPKAKAEGGRAAVVAGMSKLQDLEDLGLSDELANTLGEQIQQKALKYLMALYRFFRQAPMNDN